MARIDKAPDGTKFRARAAAALDATAGLWGDGDLLCVDLDGNGELILAAAVGDAKGVIWTPEGRRDSSKANFKEVQGGKVYTVFKGVCEIQGMEIGAAPLAAGDVVNASTVGDVVTSTPAAGAIYIGAAVPDDTVPGGTGVKLILNVNGAPVA